MIAEPCRVIADRTERAIDVGPAWSIIWPYNHIVAVDSCLQQMVFAVHPYACVCARDDGVQTVEHRLETSYGVIGQLRNL